MQIESLNNQHAYIHTQHLFYSLSHGIWAYRLSSILLHIFADISRRTLRAWSRVGEISLLIRYANSYMQRAISARASRFAAPISSRQKRYYIKGHMMIWFIAARNDATWNDVLKEARGWAILTWFLVV